MEHQPCMVDSHSLLGKHCVYILNESTGSCANIMFARRHKFVYNATFCKIRANIVFASKHNLFTMPLSARFEQTLCLRVITNLFTMPLSCNLMDKPS